jgi:hypothetical protein
MAVPAVQETGSVLADFVKCPIGHAIKKRRRIISAASSGVGAMSADPSPPFQVRGHHEAALGGCDIVKPHMKAAAN